MARRTTPLLWLSMTAALSGCVLPPTPIGSNMQPIASQPSRAAILLPLSGPQAALGQSMLQAAQLALGTDGPQLDVQDTGGTPTGATLATQRAISAGDTVIIGPLTAGETAAAAAVAQNIPILAFTSDRQQARPGVWPMGITPDQQMQRLVQVLAARGKTRVTAVLPDNIFGDALAYGLTQAGAQLPQPPDIRRYKTGSAPSLQQTLRDATGFADRRGAIDAQAQAIKDAGGDGADQAAATIRAQPMAPPNFDALVLAESGSMLLTTSSELANDGITLPQVQVVGPATWAREAANLRGLAGAWYAAPDPTMREDFVRAFTARYHTPPNPLADLAYDAARLARNAGAPATLTRPQGFVGVDGPYVLLPDGRLRRGLAVFAVGPNGPQMIEPARTFASGS